MTQVFQLRRIGLFLIAFIVIIGSSFAQEYQNGMKVGYLRIKFKAELSMVLENLKIETVDGILVTGIHELDKVNRQISVVEMKRVFPYSNKNEEKHKKYGFDLWYELRYSTKISPLEAAAAYASLSEIEKAEPILEMKLLKKKKQHYSVP